ncbi:MAG: GYD domain-containing protein [Candidatus Limnocylindrales bacterium]
MAHYLFQASYTEAGLAGLVSEGAAGRVTAIEDAVRSLGGNVEAMYWSFGKADVIVLVELPDNAAAAALSTTVAAAGVAGIKTTVLLTASEVDRALGMHPKYRAPGT